MAYGHTYTPGLLLFGVRRSRGKEVHGEEVSALKPRLPFACLVLCVRKGAVVILVNWATQLNVR